MAVTSAKYGNVEALLQQQFCDVNPQDVDGNTPAHCAAIGEYIEILSLLVNQSKYDPNVLNHKLQSADDLNPIHRMLLDLDQSLVGNSERSFANLFKHGKLLSDSDGNNVLHHLCTYDRFSDAARVLSMLLTYDPPLGRQLNNSGNCPIHRAASNEQIAILRELIRHTADDVNLPNTAGNTCLHLAVIRNKFETVKHLMKLPGVDPDLRNKDNKTACDLARDLNRTSAYAAILYTHVSDVTVYHHTLSVYV